MNLKFQYPLQIALRSTNLDAVSGYCSGLMIGLDAPDAAESLGPMTTDAAESLGPMTTDAADRTLTADRPIIWRGVSDVCATISMIPQRARGRVPSYVSPCYQFRSAPQVMQALVCALKVNNLSAPHNQICPITPQEFADLEFRAQYGSKLGVTGRLAQKIVLILYPPGSELMLWKNVAVTADILRWCHPNGPELWTPGTPAVPANTLDDTRI